MRCLGQIEGRKSAENLVAYLLTEEITTNIEIVDESRDQWEIWVRDEDRLEDASRFLNEFKSNPYDPKYAVAVKKANEILAEKEKRRAQAAKNQRKLNMAQRSSAGGPLPPLTLTLLILSIAVTLISSFGSPGPNNEWGQAVVERLQFVTGEDFQKSEGDPAASLKKGEVWRAITPIFMHLGPIHLAMNMFVLISFGRMVERWIGTPRFAIFVLILAIGPNLLQGLSPEWMRGSPWFGGISGVLYGLFGYVWIRSTLNPTLGVSIPFPIAVIFIGLIVVGLSGAVPNWQYADLCHLGGLLIGVVAAFATEKR